MIVTKLLKWLPKINIQKYRKHTVITSHGNKLQRDYKRQDYILYILLRSLLYQNETKTLVWNLQNSIATCTNDAYWNAVMVHIYVMRKHVRDYPSTIKKTVKYAGIEVW